MPDDFSLQALFKPISVDFTPSAVYKQHASKAKKLSQKEIMKLCKDYYDVDMEVRQTNYDPKTFHQMMSVRSDATDAHNAYWDALTEESKQKLITNLK